MSLLVEILISDSNFMSLRKYVFLLLMIFMQETFVHRSM